VLTAYGGGQTILVLGDVGVGKTAYAERCLAGPQESMTKKKKKGRFDMVALRGTGKHHLTLPTNYGPVNITLWVRTWAQSLHPAHSRHTSDCVSCARCVWCVCRVCVCRVSCVCRVVSRAVRVQDQPATSREISGGVRDELLAGGQAAIIMFDIASLQSYRHVGLCHRSGFPPPSH
jgi:GTPase SAR1 family protein